MAKETAPVRAAVATRRPTRHLYGPGVPPRWVTADEVYGADPRLAGCLQERGIGYVDILSGPHVLRRMKW
jgi:hypothetical protein